MYSLIDYLPIKLLYPISAKNEIVLTRLVKQCLGKLVNQNNQVLSNLKCKKQTLPESQDSSRVNFLND
jgi:hypothetical protein